MLDGVRRTDLWLVCYQGLVVAKSPTNDASNGVVIVTAGQQALQTVLASLVYIQAFRVGMNGKAWGHGRCNMTVRLRQKLCLGC